MVDSILAAFQMSINAETLLIVFIGAFYGTIIGALPGLGTVVALTMCLPFTLHMENVPAIALLLAVYCGSVFGGSISAVLINTPGTPQSAATGMDGYPMAKRGQAGQALGWVTVASVTGGLASCVVLIVATPQMAALSIRYGGPLEICALICLGLACIATLSQGNQIKGLMMGVFGLLLATVGNEPVSGMMRFTFGNRGMETGIDMLPLVVGVFPLAEVFYRIYEERSSVKAVPIDCRTIVFPLLSEWKGRFVGLLRSSGIGILIGILPGTGPTAATFISYASAKRSSKNGANFGKSEPDGLIAAESANNAVTGGALVPTLALGIPGDATLALLLATFAIHNLTPGVRLMVDFPDVVYASFITLVIANLMLIPSAILTVRLFGTLMRIPSPLFIGFILLLSLLGAFISRNLSFDLSVAIVMGLVGFAMRLWDFPAAAMLIGFVLGPQFEYRLGQVFLFKGELSWLEYFSQHPVGTGLLVITAFILLSPIYSALRRKGGDAATPDAASSEE